MHTPLIHMAHVFVHYPATGICAAIGLFGAAVLGFSGQIALEVGLVGGVIGYLGNLWYESQA